MRRYPPRPEGRHTGWTPSRDRAAQQRFRDALIRRSGGYCEYVGPEGRCTSTTDLQAHHDRAGYTPDCGRLLCAKHHKAEDPYAR
jgi:hypothetical protein